MTLPGQTFTNGVSNYIFGTNTPDYNTALMTNTGVQAQLKSAGITVIRIPAEINQVNCTDSQLDQYAAACQAVGAAMLVILRYSDLTFSKHVVQYLGSRCNLYEFSNEPDLNNITWQQYLSAWNSLIPVLRGSSYNPNAAYIGPALGDIGNNESYLTNWLSGCVSSGVMPDAISFHIYPCTSYGVIPQATCLADAPNIGKTAASLRTTVQGIVGKNLPICITEWNIDAFYGNNNHQSYSTNIPANASFIDSFTQAAIDSMAQNAVDLACEFELNYYLVNDSAPSTPEPQLEEMAEEYQKYIGGTPPPPANEPYGTTVLLDFVSNYQLPNSWVKSAKALGLSWIRIQISWHIIEPGGNGNYKWSLSQGVAVDETIQAINAQGLKAYFCVMNPPTAHKSINAGGGYYCPSPADMQPFVTALVNRYYHGSPYGTLSCIEIGNEDFDAQNDSYHNAGYLADCLNMAYPLIKSVDSLMLVGPGAHLQVGQSRVTNWHTQLYTGGGVSQSGGIINAQTGLPNMDFSNTHFYRGPTIDPTDPNVQPSNCTISLMHQEIHNVDIANGCGQLPVWITEFGWPVGSGGVTAALQSQYLQDVINSAMNSGYCTHAFFYTMNVSDSESVITSGSPPVPRQAYTDIQTLIANNPYWNSPTVSIFINENASGSELITTIVTTQLTATISEKQNETGTVSTILYGLRNASITEGGGPAEKVIVTGINIFIVTVTLPPLARRDGQTPQATRRDGAFPLDKRRDGQFPPDKRRG